MVCEKELKSLKVVVTAPKFAIYTLLVVIVREWEWRFWRGEITNLWSLVPIVLISV